MCLAAASEKRSFPVATRPSTQSQNVKSCHVIDVFLIGRNKSTEHQLLYPTFTFADRAVDEMKK